MGDSGAKYTFTALKKHIALGEFDQENAYIAGGMR